MCGGDEEYTLTDVFPGDVPVLCTFCGKLRLALCSILPASQMFSNDPSF